MHIIRAAERPSPTIAVWFSCGAASAVAAQLTLERYGDTHHVRILNNPIKEEGPDNQRFLRDVSAWLGRPIEHVVNPKYPAASVREIWDHRRAMSFAHGGATCTFHAKKEARQIWERDNPTAGIVLGFTVEERRRHDNFVLTERSDLIPVLIDAGLTKQDCFNRLAAAGLTLPSSYADGYPNANCRVSGCIKATSPTYWNHHRKHDPEGHAETAAQSRRLNVRLVRYKGTRIFLDELPLDARGRPLKNLTMPECGLFCEEKVATIKADRAGATIKADRAG
jgi:hypothetical protein